MIDLGTDLVKRPESLASGCETDRTALPLTIREISLGLRGFPAGLGSSLREEKNEKTEEARFLKIFRAVRESRADPSGFRKGERSSVLVSR